MAHTSPSTNRSQQRPSEPYLSSLIRWLQLKKYQYEVTFSLYMLTSTEKFIFSTTLVLPISSYLPPHLRRLPKKRPWLTDDIVLCLDLVLFVLISMLVVAASMYLPNHVVVIYRRIWYYVHGEIASITKSASGGSGALKTAVDGLGTSTGVDLVTATSRAVGEL